MVSVKISTTFVALAISGALAAPAQAPTGLAKRGDAYDSYADAYYNGLGKDRYRGKGYGAGRRLLDKIAWNSAARK